MVEKRFSPYKVAMIEFDFEQWELLGLLSKRGKAMSMMQNRKKAKIEAAIA